MFAAVAVTRAKLPLSCVVPTMLSIHSTSPTANGCAVEVITHGFASVMPAIGAVLFDTGPASICWVREAASAIVPFATCVGTPASSTVPP